MTKSLNIGSTTAGHIVVQTPTGLVTIGKARMLRPAADRIRTLLKLHPDNPKIEGGKCSECGAEHSVFTTGMKRVGPEATLITSTYADCGARERDMLD